MNCGERVLTTASLAIHRCNARRELPADVADEVIENSTCLICKEVVASGKPHMCSMGVLGELAVDATGLLHWPPFVYECKSLAVQNELRNITAYSRRIGKLCLSLVQLPHETSYSSTLTYTCTSSIPGAARLFERQHDGKFQYMGVSSLGMPEVPSGFAMAGVRYVPDTTLPPYQALWTDAELAEPNGSIKVPRVVYNGRIEISYGKLKLGDMFGGTGEEENLALMTASHTIREYYVVRNA